MPGAGLRRYSWLCVAIGSAAIIAAGLLFHSDAVLALSGAGVAVLGVALVAVGQLRTRAHKRAVRSDDDHWPGALPRPPLGSPPPGAPGLGGRVDGGPGNP